LARPIYTNLLKNIGCKVVIKTHPNFPKPKENQAKNKKIQTNLENRRKNRYYGSFSTSHLSSFHNRKISSNIKRNNFFQEEAKEKRAQQTHK
jgi:hypothetical protein